MIHFELVLHIGESSAPPQETTDRFIQVREGLGDVSRKMNTEAIFHNWRWLGVESMKNVPPV